MPHSLRIIDSLNSIAANQWDALCQQQDTANPTLRHAFLQSLIDAGCTTAETGWLPQFLTLWRESETHPPQLIGAVPLYVKGHSYGEYIFDWAWAEAYERAGRDYYPKLLAAVPFTPCTGARLMANTDADREHLIQALLQIARHSETSSLHILFPTTAELTQLTAHGFLARSAVQFHWQNQSPDGAAYPSFDDFLATLNHDKRKKIKQERRKISEAGIQFRHLVGRDISAAAWDFFTECYQRTYHEHRSTPYLNRTFFGLISERMPENLLLIIAHRAGRPIAAALNLFNSHTLYGRYWGSHEYHPGLHFETCYYQALAFCIAHGIQTFEGGAQGEHKLARGFLPIKCHSAHWLKAPQFARAVEDFLQREQVGIDHYIDELQDSQPYKRTQ
ncbi:MAG: N-acetyltransferase [Betaproteobacteria bacterium]|nr:N-acetyltransferase [Betaproteobacteria bacterium]